jgi:hypothetical protein
MMKGITTDWGPTMILSPVEVSTSSSTVKRVTFPLQASVHTVTSRAFINEVAEIFPTVKWKEHNEVVFLCTMQHSALELVRVGIDVETEKDQLLEHVRFRFPSQPLISNLVLSATIQFVSFAKFICTGLHQAGYFCDYFDPCSGLPVSLQLQLK